MELIYWISVTVHVKGRETEEIEVRSNPLHKKNPEVGEKRQVYSSKLLMEQEDAVSFGDSEEVRIMLLNFLSDPADES